MTDQLVAAQFKASLAEQVLFGRVSAQRVRMAALRLPLGDDLASQVIARGSIEPIRGSQRRLLQARWLRAAV